VSRDDLGFDIRESDIVGVIRPSGCGKTTIFNFVVRTFVDKAAAMK